jgi:ERCC4-related helicase
LLNYYNLSHNILKEISRINLIIFDEWYLIVYFIKSNNLNIIIFYLFTLKSHHATGNHPYSQIILRISDSKYFLEKPRIIGLTASIVNKKCDLKTFNNNMKKLEEKFE